MDKLNELMGNFENMFADKEHTRKKLSALDKSVSFFFINFVVVKAALRGNKSFICDSRTNYRR
jgi:hypothetical protein